MSNQYCFKIKSDDDRELDQAALKTFITKLYKKPSLEGHFDKDEKLPFIIILSKKDNQICIKLTSRAKKNIERIESIHSQLKAAHLNVGNGVKLEKPVLFELEQCNWWSDGPCAPGESKKWDTLEHNGPYFTHLMEPYVPHKAPLVYEGKKYVLEPEEERIANFYARRLISEQGGTITIFLTQDKVFNDNYWKDFKTYLTPEHKKIFKDFEKVDFKFIVKKLNDQKEADKNISDKEKETKKVKTAEKKADYGFAIINNIKEPVSNFVVEPAALFLGRGQNPNRGKVKRDIEPEEVTINVGQDALIPVPPEGHEWKKVIHDNTLAWIASWRDPISNELKYVYLGAEGQLKGKSDLIKYEKARKLNKFINVVRTKYEKDINSKDAKLAQLGTVLYLIDIYGLRVGNEKDETETDTVGASTLRVEHVTLEPLVEGDQQSIAFDFLGKDSIQYYKKLTIPLNIYKNFEKFIKNKKPSDSLFDLISASDINDYLKTFDKDFSAKAFRTRLASTIMDAALKKIKVKKTATQDEKKKLFDKANIEVAEVLNHRRTVPAKAKDTIKKYQDELKELNKELKQAKADEASEKKLTTIKNKITKKKDLIESKQDTLNIAISTSRTNYIDPRINVAWSKKYDLNLNKIYSAVLQRKFKWAIDMTPKDWDYVETELLKGMDVLTPSTGPSIKAGAKPGVKKSIPGKAPIKKSVTKTVPKTVTKAPTKGIEIFNYSEKSIGVLGDTKSVSQELKKLGGNWIPLMIGDTKIKGWNFSKKKVEAVKDVLNKANLEFIVVEDTTEENPVEEYVPQDANDDNGDDNDENGDTDDNDNDENGEANDEEEENGNDDNGDEQDDEENENNENDDEETKNDNQEEKGTPQRARVIEEYTPNTFIVIGDADEHKVLFKKLKGVHKKVTLEDGSTEMGWVFNNKVLEDVINVVNKVDVFDYKPTSFFITNVPKDKDTEIKKLGGISRDITMDNKKIRGWIVSKKKWKALEELLHVEINIEGEETPTDVPQIYKTNDLIEFYLGKKNLSGYSITDIFKWNNEQLSKNDDYVNLLFPTFPNASDDPLFLDKNTVAVFKNDQKLRDQVIQAALLMFDYYGYSIVTDGPDLEIKRTKPINETTLLKEPKEYKRIDRILRFLRIVDQRNLDFLLFLGLCRDIKDNSEFKKSVIKHYSFLSWMMAIGIDNNVINNYNVLTMKPK